MTSQKKNWIKKNDRERRRAKRQSARKKYGKSRVRKQTNTYNSSAVSKFK